MREGLFLYVVAALFPWPLLMKNLERFSEPPIEE